jgi:hypothetical protein
MLRFCDNKPRQHGKEDDGTLAKFAALSLDRHALLTIRNLTQRALRFIQGSRFGRRKDSADRFLVDQTCVPHKSRRSPCHQRAPEGSSALYCAVNHAGGVATGAFPHTMKINTATPIIARATRL